MARTNGDESYRNDPHLLLLTVAFFCGESVPYSERELATVYALLRAARRHPQGGWILRKAAEERWSFETTLDTIRNCEPTDEYCEDGFESVDVTPILDRFRVKRAQKPARRKRRRST
jgi:hypothetical protein